MPFTLLGLDGGVFQLFRRPPVRPSPVKDHSRLLFPTPSSSSRPMGLAAIRGFGVSSSQPHFSIQLLPEGFFGWRFASSTAAEQCDYLVDDGAEYNTTTDILLDRSHEQSLIDLMIPSLLLLINLLKKLQVASGGIGSNIGNYIGGDINGATQSKPKNASDGDISVNAKCKLFHWSIDGAVAEG